VVHVAVELLDEALVGRTGVVGEAFKVQRQPAINRICGEEAHQLLAQCGTLVWVFEEFADIAIPALGIGVEVVQVREISVSSLDA